MGQALYRKYRSKSLDEIVGQEHITTTLRNALRKGSVSHAYLLTGPRGVGKTSVARILAYEVNGLPYDETATHLDIIEIDAASNRRIEEIRDLRDKVNIAPSSARYKVYIIDEVHMLTREAFNALLKTLEEPPAHAIFILATTEIQKVPETIISRTQRFTFKPIEPVQAVEHLQRIAKAEKIKITPEALALLAEYGRGSFRDSISLLDQVSAHHTEIGVSDIEAMLGIAPSDAIERLLLLLSNTSHPKDINEYLTTLRTQGVASSQIAKQLQLLIKQRMVEGRLNLPTDTATELMRRLLSVSASNEPDDILLISLIEALPATADAQASLPSIAQPETEETDTPALKMAEVSESQVYPLADIKLDKLAATTELFENHESDEFSGTWSRTLSTIKQQYNTLYSILRMAQPEVDGQTLTLKFSFPFHQKRLDDPKNRQIISDILLRETGQNFSIICIVDKAAKNVATRASEPSSSTPKVDHTLQTINDIFGGAEVLES